MYVWRPAQERADSLLGSSSKAITSWKAPDRNTPAPRKCCSQSRWLRRQLRMWGMLFETPLAAPAMRLWTWMDTTASWSRVRSRLGQPRAWDRLMPPGCSPTLSDGQEEKGGRGRGLCCCLAMCCDCGVRTLRRRS